MKGYKILKDLVSFNTIKDLENKEIINYIEKYLKNLGFKTEHKGKYLIIDNKFNLYTFNGIDKNNLVGIKKVRFKN